MAWSAPRTWVAGEKVTAALMNTHVRDNLNAIGGAWTSYTPTLAQGVSTNIAKTVNYAKYLSIGKLVICQLKLTASGTGTAGSYISVTLPVTAAQASIVAGSGYYYDNGVGNYWCTSWLQSTGLLILYRNDTTSIGGIGIDPNIAVAASDVFCASFMYEAA